MDRDPDRGGKRLVCRRIDLAERAHDLCDASVRPDHEEHAALGGATGREPLVVAHGERVELTDYLVPGKTVIFAGEEYGTGSSRDWAAKGTQLLGIRAVVARSFERIHRSNLVGMGVLPLQFRGSDTWQSLRLTGEELVDVIPDPQLRPQSDALVVVTRADGTRQEITVTLRIDTPIEVDYYRHGGILPFVLRQLLAA